MVKKPTNHRPLVIASLMLLVVWAVVGFYWYWTGHLGSDAIVTELHICLQDTEYKPVEVFATTNEFYLCGKVIRSGQVSAGFQIFREDEYLTGQSVSLRAGTFFIPVSSFVSEPVAQVFAPGNYRVNVIVAQLVPAETHFEVLR